MANTHLVTVLARGEYSVTLPSPDAIPVPAIAEAFANLIERNARYVEAYTNRNRLKEAVVRAEQADSDRMTSLFNAGEEEGADPREAGRAAKEAYLDAEAIVDPRLRAARQANRDLLAALAEGKEQWQKKARKDAETARDKMALALRTVELQHAALHSSLGVVEGLRANATLSGHTSVSVSWSQGAGESAAAVRALGVAVTTIDKAVRTL